MTEPRFAGDIVRDAADMWNIMPERIFGPRRDSRTCAARWAVMAALDDLGWTSPRIGQYLNRHHTTVLHGLGRLNR